MSLMMYWLTIYSYCYKHLRHSYHEEHFLFVAKGSVETLPSGVRLKTTNWIVIFPSTILETLQEQFVMSSVVD